MGLIRRKPNIDKQILEKWHKEEMDLIRNKMQKIEDRCVDEVKKYIDQELKKLNKK